MFCLQNKIFYLLSLLVLTLTISPVHAANQKGQKLKQQTIDIKAQYLLLDEKKGVSKYKGNVQFTKGTLVIKADSVTLYFKNEKLTKALIKGRPADVQHQPVNEAKVHSQANSMEFFVTEDRLVLKGQAFVDQGERHFSGENIEYDTRQQTITAAGKQNSTANTENSENTQPEERVHKGRVHVIIGPIEDEDTDDKNSEKDKNE
ncbi:MAG: hypothetical protein BMS9Abin31_0871 [Gammaproteobacteria bacterium]|nr:MAG: hypothetical protein BMS9Abin31_0871 [Gammaproteobacteria bacterium]